MLRCCDIVHVRSNSWIGKQIRRATTAKNEQPSWASHVGMMFDTNLISESLSKGAIRPLTAYKNKTVDIIVTRPPWLEGMVSQRTERKARTLMLAHHKNKYPWWRIGFHFIDSMLGDRYVFRRLSLIDKFNICSEQVANDYEELFDYYFLGKQPNAVSPDDIADDNIERNWPVVWASSTDAWTSFIGSAARRK